MPRLKLITHSRQRFYERFPELDFNKTLNLPRRFIRATSNNRKIYRFDGTKVYFVWRKSDKKIITFLTEEQVLNKN